MSSIDLIPADYRERVQRTGRVRQVVWIVAGLVLLLALASVVLAGKTRELKQQTDQLRSRHALTALQREQLDLLNTRLADLNEEWFLLRGLRSGAAAEDLFLIVDRALPDNDVWFERWSFQRAGVIVAEAPRTVETGYFIVVAQESPQEGKPDWHVKTHMNIQGQARDHAALSRFVRGLYEQSEIQTVKLNRTRVREYANATVVDFELAVVLHNEPTA